MDDLKVSDKKELDLLELIVSSLKSIWKLILGISRASMSVIAFLIKKWLILAVSILVGGLITYFVKVSLPPAYSSEIILRSNTVPNDEVILYLNRIHFWCKEKNAPAISENLGISLDEASKLKDLQAFWIIDKNKDASLDYIDYKNKFNVYDTSDVRMKNLFAIKAKSIDVSLFDKLESGIYTYLKNNKVFNIQNETRLTQLGEYSNRYLYDVNQLDSLQKIKYFEETKKVSQGKDGQLIFLQDYKTQLVYEDIYKIMNEKHIVDMEKIIHTGILTTLSPFSKPLQPYSGFVYYGKYIIPLVFVFGVLLSAFLQYKKSIFNFIRKYQ